MSEVLEDLDWLNQLLAAIPLECEGMTHRRNAASDEACPCGSGRTYGRCCGAH